MITHVCVSFFLDIIVVYDLLVQLHKTQVRR